MSGLPTWSGRLDEGCTGCRRAQVCPRWPGSTTSSSSGGPPGCGARCGSASPSAPNSIWPPTTTSACRSTQTSSTAASRRCAPGAPGRRVHGWSPVTPNCTRSFEQALAEFVGAESALVFSSGYTANLGAVVALSGPGSLLVSDALTHASLVDACRLSRARVVVTPHRDVDAVEAALRDRSEERAVVVTDSVFSADGVMAPLRALHDVSPTARCAPDRRRGARAGGARRRWPGPAPRGGAGRCPRRGDDDDAVQGAWAARVAWCSARVPCATT